MNNKQYLSEQIKQRYNSNNLGSIKGLNRIDSGLNRIVYKVIDFTYGEDVKGMIIKVNYPDSNENKMELNAWKKYKNTKYEKYIVPIKEYDANYNWILMPYGESVPEYLVDEELVELLKDMNGTDISKNDFVYMDGNFSGHRCCDYATIE